MATLDPVFWLLWILLWQLAGSWILDPEELTLDPGSWILDPEEATLDPGSWILKRQHWILDPVNF